MLHVCTLLRFVPCHASALQGVVAGAKHVLLKAAR